MEKWINVVGYEGHYKVSNIGRVKSIKFNKEIMLSQTIDGSGYFTLTLHKKGVQKTHKVHQLVCMAFLNHVPRGRSIVVDHINHIKSDNRLENLQIITHRENISRRKRGASKYTGVVWSNAAQKWRAQISINKKKIHLGCFASEIEASKAYQKELNKTK